MALLAAACVSGQESEPTNYSATKTMRLFSTGYNDISDVYIEEVSVPDLVLAGLSELSSVDPQFTVARSGETFTIAINGQPTQTFLVPEASDVDGWGDLTATALGIGLRNSSTFENKGAETLYETVFEGMLSKLDNFSRYSGREEARDNRASRDGFGGIGVRIRLVDDGVRILNVMENTPAKRAGLANDDVIVEIDGHSAVGLSQREVVRRLRGPIRTPVDLTVRRGEPAERIVFTVKRAHIVPQTVKDRKEGNVAYIRISGFNQNTARMLRRKLIAARDDLGDSLAGYVIDLRSNPGGLLDQAVAVSDLFLAEGRIVSTHGRHPDSHQYFDADPDDEGEGLPVVILINGNSASASEIVAAALQDAGRAVLIGSNSYGKGTVQTVLRLPNEGELTLTWARFHAPSGYLLDGRGVLPDVCLSDTDGSATEVLQGMRQGRFTIERTIRQASVDPKDKSALKSLRAKCPVREGESDLDLKVAIGLLSDPVLYNFARAAGEPGLQDAQSERVSFN